MDTETGENLASVDFETGEILTENIYDNETGEALEQNSASKWRSSFRIKQNGGQSIKKPLTTRDLSPALIFLIPTLFIWPGIATIGIAFLEVLIHMWAHRKNKKMAQKGLFYRSPMHMVASEFCAICRAQNDIDKITKIQDKRALRFKNNFMHNVKRIVT